MSSFAIYLIGAIVLIAGLDYAAHLVHVHQQWIIVMDVIILGAAILGGASSTRTKDSH